MVSLTGAGASRYLIGGSLTSTVHGTPLATLDADLLVNVKTEHIKQLYEKLNRDFYISEEDVRNAIARRTSFNYTSKYSI